MPLLLVDPPISPYGNRNSLESVFDVSESLVPPRDIQSAGVSTVSFDGLLSEPLLLREDSKEGCGGRLWPAGILLSKYLLRNHRSNLSDKSMSVSSVPHWLHHRLHESASLLGCKC